MKRFSRITAMFAMLFASFSYSCYGQDIDMYIIHLAKSLHLAQTMAVEVLTMMVVRVEAALEVLLHTRSQT